MEIKTFYFNPIRECCYLAWDDTKACVIIDPGNYGERELQRLKDFVAERQLKPEMILLTHGHFDHVLGLDATARNWQVDAWMHPGDHDILERTVDWCAQLGLEYTRFTGTMHELADNEIVRFGNTELKVIATPGHTPGGVCFLNEQDKTLFSGDTLFAGSIGRTDHVGGDYEELIHSIVTRLLPLDGETVVLPGHGPSSSIGYERATNPFLQGV